MEMDGHICQLCSLNFDALTEQEREKDPKRRITIHHVNNNKSDHRYDNLELLCNSCNSKKRHSINNRSLKEPHTGTSKVVCVKNRIIIPAKEDSYTARKNYEDEIKSKGWLIKHIFEAKDTPIEVEVASNACANFVGNSPITAKRYIHMWSNKMNGMFQDFSKGEVKNDMGEDVLIFTDISDYESTLPKLYKKYGIE